MLRFDFTFQVPGKSLHSATGTFNEGLRLAILGPSGCGKSTFLKTLCGLSPIESGFIEWKGQELNKALLNQGLLGFSFQNSALFAHLTVKENLQLPFKTLSNFKNFAPSLQEEKVHLFLKKAQLTELADRYPHDLSGGEKKRISLLRSIIFEAPLLVLDEPFSDLDAENRTLYKAWLEKLLADHNGILIYVTHSEEDLSLSNSRMNWPNDARLLFK
ncbi:MAG: ATP-binding cassette domain-containing protein [Bdellovibrionota bacterium]